jgi:hypothetical protein
MIDSTRLNITYGKPTGFAINVDLDPGTFFAD